jgi:hypothetical protein
MIFLISKDVGCPAAVWMSILGLVYNFPLYLQMTFLSIAIEAHNGSISK